MYFIPSVVKNPLEITLWTNSSIAPFEGAHKRISTLLLSSSYIIFSIVTIVCVLPVPGGPWMSDIAEFDSIVLKIASI